MTLSVGLGRITNDPEAPIRTRKALGRLATPGLLVTDRGLTIDTNGRMVLRLNDGLFEDSNGLSVKLAPGGGLVSTSDGMAIDDVGSEFGDITVNSILVNTDANVSGNATVDGIITGASANIVGAINSLSVSATNDVSSASVDTGTITSSSITNSGNITSATALITGTADVAGTLNATGGLGTSTLVVSGNASIGGTLTAGVFNPSSISTGAIACSTITASGASTNAGSFTVGTTTVTAKLSSLATTEQLRLLYNTSNYCTFTVSSNGTTTIQAVGTNAAITLVPSGTGRVNVTGSATITGNATVLGSMAVAGDLGVDNFNCDSLSVNGNGTITGNLTVTGTISGGGGGTVPYTRMLSFLVTVFVSHGAGSPNAPTLHSFSAPGAVFGDACFCSPWGSPDFNLAGWSAAITASGFGQIRLAYSEMFGTSASFTFRVVVIGFT